MHLPNYINLSRTGELSRRAGFLFSMLGNCNICPKDCFVNRLENNIAACYSGLLPVVSSYCVHYGEEPILSGSEQFNNLNGVGNIFFGNCNLRCVYCQNYEISQNHKTEIKNEVTIERLAEIMLELQNKNVNAIGFVSPTHFVPQIMCALDIAVKKFPPAESLVLFQDSDDSRRLFFPPAESLVLFQDSDDSRRLFFPRQSLWCSSRTLTIAEDSFFPGRVSGALPGL